MTLTELMGQKIIGCKRFIGELCLFAYFQEKDKTEPMPKYSQVRCNTVGSGCAREDAGQHCSYTKPWTGSISRKSHKSSLRRKKRK